MLLVRLTVVFIRKMTMNCFLLLTDKWRLSSAHHNRTQRVSLRDILRPSGNT